MTSYHGWTHRPKELGGTDPIQIPGEAVYSIKVFRDDTASVAGDGAFIFEIPEDLDGAMLARVEGYVTTDGGSNETVMVRNETEAVDMLNDPITIEAGELNSKDATTQPTVDAGNAGVSWGDHIALDIDGAGGGLGLGVILFFTATAAGFFFTRGPEGPQGEQGPQGDQGDEGPQGDPGGIVNWTGEWDSGTTYSADDAVSWNGSSYVAIAGSTNVEPGVDSGWEAYWMVLSEGASSGSVVIHDETLVADQASFDVTSIPATYSHLKVVALLRGATAATTVGIRLRMNNDSGNNYDAGGLYASAGTALAYVDNATSSINVGDASADSAAAGWGTSLVMQIPYYADTSFFKGVLSQIRLVSYIEKTAGAWKSTSAIDRLTLFPASGDWKAGSRITVYGIF